MLYRLIMLYKADTIPAPVKMAFRLYPAMKQERKGIAMLHATKITKIFKNPNKN